MNWRRFTRRRQSDAEQAEELDAYLEMATEEYMARGMTAEAARAAARSKLGNTTLIREEVYRMNTVGFLDTLVRDIAYAMRAMRHNPVFATVAVLTLALGVGANSALFSLVNIVLIQPLPYPDSASLVRIWSSTANAPRAATATPDYREWRARSRSFEELGLFAFQTYNFTGDERPERLQAARTTASLWTVLRIQPVIGRLFDAADERWGSHRVVLLSEGLWRRHFGADAGVLGKRIQLNSEPYVVIGVLPAKSQFPDTRTEIWTPLSFAPGDPNDSRNNYYSDAIARLKPQTSIADAQKDLSRVALDIAAEVPQNKGRGVTLLGLQDTYTDAIRPTLLFLSGAGEKQQCWPYGIGVGILQAEQRHAPALVLGNLRGDIESHPREILLGIGERCMRLQPGDGIGVVIVAGIVGIAGREGKRRPDFRAGIGELGFCRKHADDDVRFAVELDPLSEHARIGAEVASPQALAQQDHAMIAPALVGGIE